jgi:hypothetical protein
MFKTNNKMGKKYSIETEEVQRILSLHEGYKKTLVNEQAASAATKKNRQELIQFFANARAYGCLTDPNLVYDSPFRLGTEDRSYIKGPSKSMKGKDKRVYDDFTYTIVEPATGVVLNQGVWVCAQLQPKKEEPKIEGPKPLNQNQIFVLSSLKPKGWLHEPAPTDVEVDQGLYQKLDLTGVNNVDLKKIEGGEDLLKQLSKWFPAKDFKDGFFVYKKTSPQTPTVQRKTGLTVTAESCKIAIETLWDSVKNPNSYSLTDQEVSDYKTTAEICAQPENSEKFLLRFRLKDKLKDLVNSKYRINSRL